MNTTAYSAFNGYRLLASGTLESVLAAVRKTESASDGAILIFDHSDGKQCDFDPREPIEDPAKTRVGRPKLGVQAVEVTLLPRHWDWLAKQPMKASGTLRRLVEEARAKERTDPAKRSLALGTILWSLAGNLPGFEEAGRALYALDLDRLFSITDSWPDDLPAFVRSWFAYADVGGATDPSLTEALIDDIYALTTKKGLTVATAESCTGGLLASRIIDRPGASAFFLEGAVTYSNASKIARLGVQEETLLRRGAVSEETAIEMAAGIARTAGATAGISTTGIAGPGGGSPDKPVGLVYIGLCTSGEARAEKYVFAGPRSNIRDAAVLQALRLLRAGLMNL